MASSHDDAKKLEFTKTTGSNFRLINRELVSDPRGAWEVVWNQRVSGGNQQTPLVMSGATTGEAGEIDNQRRLLDSVRTFFKDNPTWK